MIKTRLQQISLIIGGAVIAVIMVMLGLWQMQVFENQGQDGAIARMNEPAVALSSVAVPGEQITDGYGRTVTFSGTYAADDQLLVPDAEEEGTFRVLTPVLLEDGSYIPVVRGEITEPALVEGGGTGPTPPPGTIDQSGVLLAPEKSADAELPEGQIASIYLPLLIQEWEPSTIGGFVTLSPEQSQAQGLQAVTPELPSGRGSAQNFGYALQWWVFALVALGFPIYLAILVGRNAERRRLAQMGLIGEDEVGPDPSRIA